MQYKHIAVGAITASLFAALVVTGNAEAQGRRCGPTYEADHTAAPGTPWTLKSKHDDDGPGGSFVVGEEFQIHTDVAGRLWTITFADNGLVFFTGDDVSAVGGITEMHQTPNQPGTVQHMTAHAVDHATGEIIDAAVDVKPVPACGG